MGGPSDHHFLRTRKDDPPRRSPTVLPSGLGFPNEESLDQPVDANFLEDEDVSKKDTPWKINMDHKHGGLVQIIFLSK